MKVQSEMYFIIKQLAKYDSDERKLLLLGKELGLSGLFMPWLIVAQITKTYKYLVIFYFVFSVIALGGARESFFIMIQIS